MLLTTRNIPVELKCKRFWPKFMITWLTIINECSVLKTSLDKLKIYITPRIHLLKSKLYVKQQVLNYSYEHLYFRVETHMSIRRKFTNNMIQNFA